jgi:L-asparaginase
MAPDPTKNGALSPVEGAVTTYMKEMKELNNEHMPEVVVHEYTPFFDSSDLGPPDWVSTSIWYYYGLCMEDA